MMYTKTIPRKWNNDDIKQLQDLKENGYSNNEIADILNRSEVSIQIKLKRLKKKNNTYNSKHVTEKRTINRNFIEYIKPDNILDLYAGDTKETYNNIKIITNDKDIKFNTNYHEDALKLLCKFYIEGKKFDYINLDPFGSCYDNLDLAIKLCKKGIAITLGELGHKRWKRLDYVRTHYNINSMEDFTIENIIKKIQQIGLQNKKELVIYEYKEWQNIGRVWFEIKPIKVTDQWDK